MAVVVSITKQYDDGTHTTETFIHKFWDMEAAKKWYGTKDDGTMTKIKMQHTVDCGRNNPCPRIREQITLTER